MNHNSKVVTFATVIFIGIVISVIVAINYYGNQQLIEQQSKIALIKHLQQNTDASFYQEKDLTERRLAAIKSDSEAANRDFVSEINSQQEAISAGKEPLDQDADGDGIPLSREQQMGTSDLSPDTDLDGVPDPEDPHPIGGGETYRFTVSWTHNGFTYQTEFGIPSDRYTWYKRKPRVGVSQVSTYVTYTDPAIQSIAEDISDAVRTQKNPCIYCAAIDFVESMVYQYDIDYNGQDEYPKFPIETIVDKRGDCEDTSYLMASILKALNIDTVILLYSNHAAVGVACDGCQGKSYTYQRKNYFFLETTGTPESWKLGQAWGKYETETPEIFPIP